MILADTGIWIDHLRNPDPVMSALLARNAVLIHPYVLGELALGHVRDRAQILLQLGRLTFAEKARDEEVANLIVVQRLFGRGIGYVDVHLLASVLLTREALLWTRDKRLDDVAREIGVAMPASVRDLCDVTLSP